MTVWDRSKCGSTPSPAPTPEFAVQLSKEIMASPQLSFTDRGVLLAYNSNSYQLLNANLVTMNDLKTSPILNRFSGDMRLRSLHNEANEFGSNHPPRRGTREWTFAEFTRWQMSGGDAYVFSFKQQWVSGYRDAIIAAAERFDIPPELLAGVAYNEVAGDPLSVDDAAYAARPRGNGPDQRDRTSFGNVSIQVRRASESLGYGDSTRLSDFQRRSLISSLKDPEANIFIVAKHLSDIRDQHYPYMSGGYTYEQIVGIGTRYNRGPNLTESQVAQNDSYGMSIATRLPSLRRMIGLGN
jgi:hypothetical protein